MVGWLLANLDMNGPAEHRALVLGVAIVLLAIGYAVALKNARRVLAIFAAHIAAARTRR